LHGLGKHSVAVRVKERSFCLEFANENLKITMETSLNNPDTAMKWEVMCDVEATRASRVYDTNVYFVWIV